MIGGLGGSGRGGVGGGERSRSRFAPIRSGPGNYGLSGIAQQSLFVAERNPTEAVCESKGREEIAINEIGSEYQMLASEIGGEEFG